MIININKIAKELKIKTPDLITRSIGRIMYNFILEQMIPYVNDNEIIILDFEGIKVIDSSFIDEFIVKLLLVSRGKEQLFFVKLKNISHTAEINIDLVFRSYSNYKNKKIVIMTEDICQNNSFYIGPLSAEERDIIEYLRINRSGTIQDLMNFTGLLENKLITIMDELFSIRIIRRRNSNIFEAI